MVLHHAGNATIHIPNDLHKVLRLFCKLRGLSQAHVATEAITGYIHYQKIKEEKKKSGATIMRLVVAKCAARI